MIEPLDKEINVDEIMERIREEVRRRKGFPKAEAYNEGEPLPSEPQPVLPMPVPLQPPQEISKGNFFEQFLWKYGRKYKKIIKKFPILNLIAQKQHQRLLQKFISSSPISFPSYSSPVNFNVLPYYINYHGFLEQAKQEEGVKGWIKYHLFKTIRYFGWWQEQINRALYQELVDQKGRMAEKEREFQALHQQQINHLIEELNKRDSILNELNRHLMLLIQSREEIHQRLESYRERVEASEKQFHEAQTQHFSALEKIMEERFQFIEDKLSSLKRSYDSLQDGLIDQKNKIENVHQGFTSQLNQKIKEIKHEIDKQDKKQEEIYERLSHFQQASEKLDQKLSLQEKHLNEFENNIQQFLDQGLKAIRTELNNTQVNLKNEIDSFNHKLSETSEIKSNLPKIFHEMLHKEEKLSDMLYFNFENQFRGTREEIKERFKIYLPYIKEAGKKIDARLTLDLGCGRGEWLELLNENGFKAKGLDSNSIMVRECRGRGLDVTEQDAIDYLNSQPSDQFVMITGFHLLEHLSVREIYLVLKETFRVLLPGGIAIFETPNPENVIVATHYFHLDPTHRHLLPPELLEFLLRAVGFKKSEIMRSQPLDFSTVEETDSTNVKWILKVFNQAQDYSIIGYKE